MTNKFREIQQGMGEIESPGVPTGPFGLDGGFRGDLNSSDLDPTMSHEVLDVRFENAGLRPDWGRTLISDTGKLVVAAGIAPLFETFEVRYVPYYVVWNSVTSQFDFYKKDYGSFDADFVLQISGNLIITNAPRYDSFFFPLSSPIIPLGHVLFTSLETGIFEWNQSGVAAPALNAIVGAPNAKVMTNFGDRIVAGWDGFANPEAFSWTADGIYDDWVGGDSGQTFLLGVAPHEGTVRRDNVASSFNSHKQTSPGAITGLVEVGNNVLAIIRANSIYRGFETGNVALAVGATPWIQEMGCLAHRTVVKSKFGAMFLGNDYDVYILNESSLNPIGGAIKDELREISQGHFKFFSAAYIHTTDEFILSFSDRRTAFPDSGANQPPDSPIAATATWAIQVKDALAGKPAWRKLSIDGSILGGFVIWP